MYKHTTFQNNTLPPIKRGNIVKSSTLYGSYVGIVVHGVVGYYSYVNLQTGGRIFEPSSTLSWDSVFQLVDSKTNILVIWDSIDQWILDGSPLS